MLGFGVNTRETVPPADTLEPNVPRPADVSIFAYSVMYTSRVPDVST